jgi:hypothetical protein
MLMTKRLDEKLARFRAGDATRRDFILADAKDADMAFGVTAPGPCRDPVPSRRPSAACWKSLDDYRQQIRAVVTQGVVDIVLLSASNLEKLAIDERIFEHSAVTPAARANDTTDIWCVRGGKYPAWPSRPFRTASIEHIKYGRLQADCTPPPLGADLGLYSITFTNHAESDLQALRDFADFRHEAEAKRFRYFLEVFNPNVDPGIPRREIPGFVNDHVVRALAGITSVGRPLFLKIPYNGPRALEELVAYDPSIIVGIMGGSAGTTLDAFQLLHEAQKHGACAALFGRKINLSEQPLVFIEFLRRIADGEIGPVEAVKAYHAALAKQGIKPLRSLRADLQMTANRSPYRR